MTQNEKYFVFCVIQLSSDDFFRKSVHCPIFGFTKSSGKSHEGTTNCIQKFTYTCFKLIRSFTTQSY